jgi:hypothetical protein
MKRVIVRTIGAMVAGGVIVWAVVWYASVHRHLPEDWPRVYVASGCPASEFAMAVAEGVGREVSLVTIPLDNGELAERACRHTVGLLAKESVVWAGLRVLPESVVCSRMIIDGAHWMARGRYTEWPVFVGGDGAVHVGADVEGLRVVGIAVSEEEHERMVAGLKHRGWWK